jgi:Tfp pilus assembly protein PilN
MNEINLLLNEERDKASQRIKKIKEARQAYSEMLRMQQMIHTQYGHNVPPDILEALRQEIKLLAIKYGAGPELA